MRIDPNSQAQPAAETTQNSNPISSGNAVNSASSNALGEDQASLSGAHIQVQALAAEVLQFPEVRQEKVNALRQVVADGSYKPSSDQIADAMFAHMQATPAA
jgi:flagellar biosynthesis anti-sigma factor FlgM